MMKKRIKLKWVAALRSGIYAQAVEDLRQGDAFCVLGVLCDLYEDETGEDGFDDDDDLPPSWVSKWAGVERNPRLVYSANTYYLTELNDVTRLTFSELADLIEAQL